MQVEGARPSDLYASANGQHSAGYQVGCSRPGRRDSDLQEGTRSARLVDGCGASIADMGNAGLDLAEEATACEFFGEALMADAVELGRCRDRRDGPNVAPLNTPGQT